MGTVTVRLTLPATDFVQLADVELRFTEEGVSRVLTEEEWKAYFPGCSYPVAMKRIGGRNDEVVWWSTITDRLLPMANAAGFMFDGPHPALEYVPQLHRVIDRLMLSPNQWQIQFGPSAIMEDTEPPTVYTLLGFLRELQSKCMDHPTAVVSVSHGVTAPHNQQRYTEPLAGINLYNPRRTV